jgi:hypothetical protein
MARSNSASRLSLLVSGGGAAANMHPQFNAVLLNVDGPGIPQCVAEPLDERLTSPCQPMARKRRMDLKQR